MSAVTKISSVVKENKEFTFDASQYRLGRLASEIASILSGKREASYAPNQSGNKAVVVFNTDQIKISGQKPSQKIYYRHTGYIGNLKAKSFEDLLKQDSRKVLLLAVSGMLPKNRLRKIRLKNLKLYKSSPEK